MSGHKDETAGEATTPSPVATDAATPALTEAPPALANPATNFRVALPNFEGPLDLLLHLIREHKSTSSTSPSR